MSIDRVSKFYKNRINLFFNVFLAVKYSKEDSEELSGNNFGDDSIKFHHFEHWDEANNLFKKIKEKCKSKIGRSCVLLDCQKLTKLKQAGSNNEGKGGQLVIG